jgi:hypothetical protein
MTTIGRLTRNTACQSKCSISHPPVTGPIAMPRPETAAHAAMACGRSSAGKMFVMIERLDGMMNAPPRPMIARLAISIPADPLTAESADPTSWLARS